MSEAIRSVLHLKVGLDQGSPSDAKVEEGLWQIVCQYKTSRGKGSLV